MWAKERERERQWESEKEWERQWESEIVCERETGKSGQSGKLDLREREGSFFIGEPKPLKNWRKEVPATQLGQDTQR